MKIRELSQVLHSTTGNIQFAIVYDLEQNLDLVSGCSIDYAVKEYGERELKRIEAFENQLILII